jgi:hypothetical protein
MLKKKTFEEALKACDDLIASNPGLGVLASVKDQIVYLEAVFSGSADASRVKDVVLGIQVARQLEPLLSPPLIALFYEIADFASRLRAADPSLDNPGK